VVIHEKTTAVFCLEWSTRACAYLYFNCKCYKAFFDYMSVCSTGPYFWSLCYCYCGSSMIGNCYFIGNYWSLAI